ncbi:MAG: AAA family ATPase [Reyranella sp.]|nr:AAA family ATPase [Reyranella sp.]
MIVGDWLKGLGLGQYEATFRDNEIDASVLPDLTDDDLEKLRIPLGHRKRLLKAIAALGVPAIAPGASAPPAAPEGAERRQLTVFFCDLVGSTALSARLDPEDMRAIIGAYHRCCAAQIERHGGFVAKYMGDGVLAYFGYPHAHEHDAERAVQAGLSLAAAVPGLATESGTPLSVRVGIATGTVVVGDVVGSGDSRERGVVGETPNLAARLQSIAEPGMVVVADGTRRLLGDLFELADLGSRDLKGIAGPTRAWAALRASAAESRFDALQASGMIALVGREEESELLARRWIRVTSGEGQVVQLSGEAGIGKSRLTAALMAHVADVPHRRLRYFCSPQHTDSALHPVIVQMERAAGLADAETPQGRLDRLDDLLRQTSTAPEDAALLAEMLSLPNDGRHPSLDLSPPQRRQMTLQALVAQLEALTRQAPVLMIFEDAHWTDPTSLELFRRVVDRIATLPVLLIVTARPEFKPPWIGRPHVTALTLNRLAQRDVGAMIDRVIGDRPLPASIRQDIIERTDGIPLFVEEMTKAVLEADSDSEARRTAAAIPSPALVVPASLHASLMARLDRLGPAKEVVQIGAAIGREFSHALLAAVAAKPEAELGVALDRLVDAGLLSRHGMPPHANYLFKHALVQDAAYGVLLREPRRALHARIAETLESQFTDLTASEPEIVAHHFSRAERAESAYLYYERAGDRSVARSAFAEALAHFNAALVQASNLPQGAERGRRELAILLKQGPAIMMLRGQRVPEIEQIYRSACDIAVTLDDDQRLFKALWGLWLYANLNGRTDVARDQAEELVALGNRSGREELILEAIHCRWSTANFRGDVAGTLADARDGLKLYDPARHGGLGAEFGAHDPGVCAYVVQGFAFAQQGRPREAAENVDRSIALAQELKHVPTTTFALANALTTYRLIDDRAAVIRQASQVIDLADRLDLPGPRALARFFAAWARACGDEVGAGLQAMEAEFQNVSVMGSMPALYAGMLAGVRLEAGQAAQALELLDRVLSTVKEPRVGLYLSEIHRLRGECLLRAVPPDVHEAVHCFESAIATAKQQQARAFWLSAAIGLARTWSSVGQPEKGARPLREAVSAFSGDDVPAQLATARQVLSGLPQQGASIAPKV